MQNAQHHNLRFTNNLHLPTSFTDINLGLQIKLDYFTQNLVYFWQHHELQPITSRNITFFYYCYLGDYSPVYRENCIDVKF